MNFKKVKIKKAKVRKYFVPNLCLFTFYFCLVLVRAFVECQRRVAFADNFAAAQFADSFGEKHLGVMFDDEYPALRFDCG